MAHGSPVTGPQRPITADAGLLVALLVTATGVAVLAALPLWAALPAVLAVTAGTLWRFRTRTHASRFGLANWVTLFRLNLVALMLVTVWPGAPDTVPSWPLFLIAATALVLDGVDGWLARRRREAGAFGERFDMGADTAFTIITTLCLVGFGLVGAWVLLLGLLRPAFAAAARLRPEFAAPLPESRGRKIACAGSLTCLVAGLAPPLAGFAPALALAALVQLLWSFGRDFRYLLRDNTGAPAADSA
jgi:phosphatidylglycerophosphate synthase